MIIGDIWVMAPDFFIIININKDKKEDVEEIH